MKTILIPTDFSANANNALEYAAEISHHAGASLHLLHVYTPIVSRSNIISALITDEVEDAKKEALDKLHIFRSTLESEYPGISCKTSVSVGEAVEEILNATKAINADLIIMGTLGASNLARTLFGSNTASVIEKSACPVLCVPAECTFKVPKRILFSTNFSYDDIQGVIKLVSIARPFKSEIMVGHIDTSTEEDAEEASMQKFVKEVELATNYPKFTQKIVSDHNVSMGLDLIIQEYEVDLVALSTHKRNFFEKFYNPSLTKKISLYSSIPILVFQNPHDDEDTGKDF
ncbi:MAG: universal stress protein [Cyclobacteriaceae bacterium]